MGLRWAAQLAAGALVWGPHFDTGGAAAPNAPTDVAGEATSGTEATSTWVDASGDETGFLVELSTDGGATWSTAGTVGAGVQTFAHTGLSPATAYRTGVTALGVDADSVRVVSPAWATDNTGSGGGDLGQVAPVTEAILYVVPAERRIYTAPAEDRVFRVPA